MDKRASHGGSSSRGMEVLDVKPLRSLSPMFPTPFGNTSVSPPGGPPFLCISPFGPSPSTSQPGHNSGFSPVFPSFASPPSNTRPADDPPNVSNGLVGRRGSKGDRTSPLFKIDGSPGSSSKGKIKRQRPKPADRELLMLPSSSSEDPKESVEVILMTFDALRRRILQLEDGSNVKKNSVNKAGATMMDYDLRANKVKRVGPVPGIEVGDIFYFRLEMLLVGLHAQSMAGIDRMSAKFDGEDDIIAVSVVSSGNYEDETDMVDSLVYSGQGGKITDNKQTDDQKLERGNLGLERSFHRANEIRVIRGMKDLSFPTGKIFVYDGLYKIHQSWVEKSKSGFNTFKYKLLRQPNQPEAFAVWKTIEKWKENPSARGRVILPDMSSGEESFPVCLVNEVDTEKGPAPFSYATKVKHLIPITSTLPLQGCSCHNGCLSGDGSCSCVLRTGGALPYSSDGSLVSCKPLIYECSPSCLCSGKCRNRVTQKGIKLRFEVFRTRDRGWGLRSWDPIRAGSFICEYVGEIMDKVKIEDDGEEDEFVFEASHSDEKAFQWNYGPELLGEPSLANLADTSKPPPIVISAKRFGNVARFMNHSCSPNAFWQPVQHDHSDENFPHIMFFASKHIPPMTELTYDYGLGGREPKRCLCGSSKCRGFFG